MTGPKNIMTCAGDVDDGSTPGGAYRMREIFVQAVYCRIDPFIIEDTYGS